RTGTSFPLNLKLAVTSASENHHTGTIHGKLALPHAFRRRDPVDWAWFIMEELEKSDKPTPSECQPAPAAENTVTPSEPAIPEETVVVATAAPSVETPSPPVSPGIRLDKKHPLAIRWMHWINFPVLFTMIWSGLLIYWNDSDNAYKHPHAVYQLGLGSFTLFRFFPTWFWKAMNAPYHVTEG